MTDPKAERLDTYHRRAPADATMPQRRFEKLTPSTVVGQTPTPEYAAAANWSADPVPATEPIDATDCGPTFRSTRSMNVLRYP
jgi:hypothetical protein